MVEFFVGSLGENCAKLRGEGNNEEGTLILDLSGSS